MLSRIGKIASALAIASIALAAPALAKDVKIAATDSEAAIEAALKPYSAFFGR